MKIKLLLSAAISAFFFFEKSNAQCLTCPASDFTITPTSAWQVHSSSHGAGDCRIYEVNVTAGTSYIFKLGCGDGGNATYDTYIELYDSSCNFLIDDDDGCNQPQYSSLLVWSAPYTGVAYLLIKGFDASAFGNYDLAYSEFGGCTACPNFDFTITPSTSWQVHSSQHGAGECKLYKVPVVNGINYGFKTGCGDGANAVYDTYLELYDSACLFLFDDDDGCTSTLQSELWWTATFTGDVFLKVRGYDFGEFGNYDLAYTAVGALAVSEINSPEEFTLFPNPAQGITTLHNKPGTEIKSVTLFNLTGQRVHSQAVAGNPKEIKFDFSRIPAGMYQLKILTPEGERNIRVVIADN